MGIKDLINLYRDFCEKVQALQLFGVNIKVRKTQLATSEQIAAFEQKYQLVIPEDIRYFWENCPYELSISPDYKENQPFFNAGFDFSVLQHIERDLTSDRELSKNYPKKSLEARLHGLGIGLSFSEPRLFSDLGSKQAIYFVLYDGTMPKQSIAGSFTEFFEHYLAAGCFCSHDFEAYWQIIKGIVPIQIPLAKNKWIQFYAKTYKKDYKHL